MTNCIDRGTYRQTDEWTDERKKVKITDRVAGEEKDDADLCTTASDCTLAGLDEQTDRQTNRLYNGLISRLHEEAYMKQR